MKDEIGNYLDPIDRLNKDLIKAIRDKKLVLSRRDIRYVVDLYYQIQDARIRAAAQMRAAGDEPTELVNWIFGQMAFIENQIKRPLKSWCLSHETSQWALGIKGIGPVLAAGLSAHIDVTTTPSTGHLHSFAGLNPHQVWLGKKGAKEMVKEICGDAKEIDDEMAAKVATACKRRFEIVSKYPRKRADFIAALAKRPWNATLKVLCWKIGESFVKISGRANQTFGALYAKRKVEEEAKNENGDFADQAAKALEEKNISKSTEAYKHYSQGKLPPAHIHARAKRYAVKLFLSLWHEVAYRNHFKKDPPKPYPFEHLGHTHKIDPDNVE